MRRTLIILAILTLCACGKKGMLVPPEALAPAPIKDLKVSQKGDAFQVSWTAPTRLQGGDRLIDLSGFVLMRHEVLPEGEDCDACFYAYRTVAEIDPNYPGDVRRIGNFYIYTDRDIVPGKSYRYKAHAISADGGQSTDSNKPQKLALLAPHTPKLEVVPGTTGMTLTFSMLEPDEGKVVGYNIYRRKVGDDRPVMPINAAPVAHTKYEDQEVQHRVRYSYVVRAVVQIGNEIVESAPSQEVPGTLLESEYP